MIPLHKLAKLPRSQRLRKTGKIFDELERRLARNRKALYDTAPDGVTDKTRRQDAALDAVEYARLAEVLELLEKDDGFPPAAAELFRGTLETLERIQAAAKTPDSDAVSEESAALLRPLALIRRLLLAETGRFEADWDFVDHGGRLDVSGRRPFPGVQVYLEDIRSPFNVGAMFRSAESFGAEKIWISPLCADPRHPRAARTAMGCIDVLPWERIEEIPWNKAAASGETPPTLPHRNPPPFSGPLFALETGGTNLSDFPFPPRGTMIVGSEELGVSPQALARADASLGRVSIPTFGLKGSLNASAAFAIVMQAWAAALEKSVRNATGFVDKS
ncbi:MAG: TrmH family RNA methyltransferase [Treponema sp.]|jgi:TrmH family RNA methyltransferase|nr:TrmH family RNA methyltransferase [Treponema sp.]